MVKKYPTGSIGKYLQDNQKLYDKLTVEQKKEIKEYFVEDFKIFSTPQMIRPVPPWMQCFLLPQFCNITTTKDNFGSLKPCGVAVSKLGKVAVSAINSDNTPGMVFVWSSFSDFKSGKVADCQFTFTDPEAVVFDNNEGLFIASTSTGYIYYLKTFSEPAYDQLSYPIDANTSTPTNWNPRGMAVDANNNLYVMCENLYVNAHPSAIVKVTSPTMASHSQQTLSGSLQSAANALGVSIHGSQVFTTDLQGDSIHVYNTNSGWTKVTRHAALQVPLPLDLVSDGTYVYFTNLDGGSNVVRWNISNGNTDHIGMGSQIPGDGITTCWGVAIYNGYLIVADALHNGTPNPRVRIMDITTPVDNSSNPKVNGWKE